VVILVVTLILINKQNAKTKQLQLSILQQKNAIAEHQQQRKDTRTDFFTGLFK
jgi:hypothetical protein